MRTSPGDQKRAVGFLSVSTDEQRVGPEAQRAAIAAWAARESVTVVAWHQDSGVSGESELDQRAGLIAALGELRAEGAGVLVVARRDRLVRDVAVAVTVEKADFVGSLVLPDGDPRRPTAWQKVPREWFPCLARARAPCDVRPRFSDRISSACAPPVSVVRSGRHRRCNVEAP